MLLKLQTFKDFLGTPLKANAEYDQQLAATLRGVEATVARYCGRVAQDGNGGLLATLEYTTGVKQVWVGRLKRKSLRLGIYPVKQLTSLKGEIFAGSGEEDLDSTLYSLNGATGEIIFSDAFSSITAAYEVLRATYDGGFLSEEQAESMSESELAGHTKLPDDLKIALLETARWNWKDGAYFGVKSVGEEVTEWLFPPQCKSVFDAYRKFG